MSDRTAIEWTQASWNLLVDINHLSGFMDVFTHAAGGETRTPEIERHIYATLIVHPAITRSHEWRRRAG